MENYYDNYGFGYDNDAHAWEDKHPWGNDHIAYYEEDEYLENLRD